MTPSIRFAWCNSGVPAQILLVLSASSSHLLIMSILEAQVCSLFDEFSWIRPQVLQLRDEVGREDTEFTVHHLVWNGSLRWSMGLKSYQYDSVFQGRWALVCLITWMDDRGLVSSVIYYEEVRLYQGINPQGTVEFRALARWGGVSGVILSLLDFREHTGEILLIWSFEMAQLLRKERPIF